MKTLMHSFTASVAATALALACFSTSAAAEKPKWANKASSSIAEFAIGASGTPFELDNDGGDFDILVAALIATGTVNILDGTDYTVFAPNDQAFYTLTGTDNDTDAFNGVVSLIGVDGVAAVLAYHVTEGVRNSRSVTRSNSITMLDGNSVYYDDGFIEANQSAAGLLSVDNRVSDGMVHIIDTVLLP